MIQCFLRIRKEVIDCAFEKFTIYIKNSKEKEEIIKTLKVAQNLIGIQKAENFISELEIHVKFNMWHDRASDDVIQRRIQETQYRCETHFHHVPVGNCAQV